MEDLSKTNWFGYMNPAVKNLAEESFVLLEAMEKSDQKYVDYGFVIFPIAKAYEGFLKQLFFDLGLINKQQYQGEHFRIGKALNPNLPIRYRSGWVYQDLAEYCGGEALPQQLWSAWKNARNQVFHFFPNQDRPNVTLIRARELVEELGFAMERAIAGCDLRR